MSNRIKLAGLIITILILLGADWNKFYGPPGNNIKFIKIETPIGPAYLNCAHIISIRKTNTPTHQGQTEIILGKDGFHTKESIESIIERIIEK